MRGETRRTTAHLANEIDDSYQEIESLHGRDGARLAAESHTAAIDLIERIVQEENIDCDFVRLDGFLFNPADGDTSFIDKELEAARRAGLNPERLLQAPLPFPTGALDLHRCSAVCTHLACLVSWNAVEKTWDCPCHRSRFGIDGDVLNGPAVSRLRSADPSTKRAA
jgi:nitrite reductase/ring-hydroxylating ferredoxin subunit